MHLILVCSIGDLVWPWVPTSAVISAPPLTKVAVTGHDRRDSRGAASRDTEGSAYVKWNDRWEGQVGLVNIKPLKSSKMSPPH